MRQNCCETSKENNHSEDVIADEKIILKLVEGKQDISCIYMAQDTVQSRVAVNTSGNTSALNVGHLLKS